LIIKSFNERWFQGWDVTPDDQRVKFVSLSRNLTAHPDFKTKVADNADVQNRDLAFKKILDDVMSQQRKNELDLYRLYAQDTAFRQAFVDTMKRMSGVASQ
jgi:type I restriction enzyme, R subunit